MLSSVTSKIIFLGVIIFFIWIQYKVDPFQVPEANQMEFILLCCLPFVIMGQMPGAVGDDSTWQFVMYTMTVLILLPAPLLVFYAIRLVYKAHREWKQGGDEQKENLLGDEPKSNDSRTDLMGTNTMDGVVSSSGSTPEVAEDGDFGATNGTTNGTHLVSDGDGAGRLEVEMGALGSTTAGGGHDTNGKRVSTTLVEDTEMREIQAITDDLVMAMDDILIDDMSKSDPDHVEHPDEIAY